MKKIILICTLILTAYVLKAANDEATTYVTVNGKTIFCQDVKFGLSKVKIIMPNGEVTKVAYSNVDSYQHDGKLFDRLPVVDESNKTTCCALMEYQAQRNGLKLYKYTVYEEDADLSIGVVTKAHPVDYYFVFKDGKYYLRLDNKNAAQVLDFFGVKTEA